jgi:DNA invertase Pin-like site-specific DNA recombinase
MTRAAIYARTSTVQNASRQINDATAYATQKGWAVTEEHIYVDPGASGVQYDTRPGLVRLLNVLKSRPPFQVLLITDASRLGRNAMKTANVLEQIVNAGVQILCYGEDRERTLAAPTSS